MTATGLHERNRSLYAAPDVVRFYATRDSLYPAERAILSRYATELRESRLLDIGVGAGRTATHLSDLAAGYTGIDYAPEMIERCRARYPEIDFRCGDARRLSEFEDARFGTVFFSNNGIDHMTPADRRLVLAEVHRVLAPGGLFLFSTQNLDSKSRRRPHVFKGFAPGAPSPARLAENARRFAFYLRGIANYLASRRYESRGDGYAMLANPIHNFRLVMYWATVPHQVRQLAAAGFHVLEAFGFEGGPLPLDLSTDDPFVYFVARKGGAKPTGEPIHPCPP